MSLPARLSAALCLTAAMLAPGWSAATGTRPGVQLPVNGLGVSLPADWLMGAAGRLPDDWHSPSAAAPVYVRLVVEDAALENPGILWDAVEMLRRRGLEPVLVLEPPGGGDDSGGLGFDLEEWLARIDRGLAGLGTETFLVQIMDRPHRRLSPRVYAYVLKRVALLIRTLAPAAYLATGDMEDSAALQALGRTGLGPYLDAVCVGGPAATRLALAATAREAFPVQQVWVSGAGGGGGDYMQEAAGALAAAVALVLAAPGAAPPAADLAAWRAVFDAEAAVVPREFVRISGVDGGGLPLPSESLVELERGAGRGRYVLLFPGPQGQRTLVARGPRVGIAWIVDLRSGEESIGGTANWITADSRAATGGEAGAEAGESVIVLPPVQATTLVRLSGHGQSPLPSFAEDVRGERGLSVEEIIARHLQFQAGQERALRSLVADARIDYHFSLANFPETFDVTTVNRFFQESGSSTFEEREIYLNGSRWRGNKPPDLPFILPERVTDVPLDLRLDQRYTFRLVGREEVSGREAYVVEFEPLPATEDAHTGKVWIDDQEFSKLRIEVVELEPALPVISNKLVETFALVQGATRSWWLPVRVEGQMVFTALGRNVVLERVLDFSGFNVNPEDLEQQLDAAYASPHQLVQESGGGFRRLRKVENDDGSYNVTEGGVGSTGVSRLLVGGFTMGDDLDPGLPFVGVNYFNFDFRGTGTQLDVAWAGPFINVFWSDPRLGGSKAILALEARVNPIESTDRRLDVADGIQSDAKGERLQRSSQTVAGLVGLPLGVFHKIEAETSLEYLNFDGDGETDPTFVVPADTLETSLALRWIYNRAGFRLEWGVQGGVRDGWEPWGRPDGSDYSPADRRWVRSALVLNKNIYPRGMDRLGFRLFLFDGNGLDRFSRFNFGQLGEGRVSGFSGAGLRADRGGIIDLNASFSVRGRSRLDLAVNHARFLGEEDFGPGVQHATGGSVALNFSGPWNTFIRVRVASALDSSIDDTRRNGSLRVTVFRTFDHWFWQKAQPVSRPQRIRPTP